MNLLYQKHKARFGSLYRLGSDSNSDSSQNTSTTTSNVTTNTDKSFAVGDNSVGLSGDNNTIDKHVVNDTNFLDLSNRSTNFADSSNRSSTTTFTDNSNRSTNFADNRLTTADNRATNTTNSSSTLNDNSNRSVVNTVTDFGALTKSIDSVGSLANFAITNNGKVVDDAFQALKSSNEDQLNIMKTAFGYVNNAGRDSINSAKDVLSFAAGQTQAMADTYAASKADPNQKMMMAAIVGIAIVGATLAYKK